MQVITVVAIARGMSKLYKIRKMSVTEDTFFSKNLSLLSDVAMVKNARTYRTRTLHSDLETQKMRLYSGISKLTVYSSIQQSRQLRTNEIIGKTKKEHICIVGNIFKT